MNTICLYFQIHQPFRFRRYRFFDIGTNHYYYDDYTNESTLIQTATRSYLPANKIILDLIKEYGSRFKVAFSISGSAIDQFKLYAPEVLESFKQLAQTGCVEFLSETYSHSLVSMYSRQEFENQVKAHEKLILETFGKKPVVFRNTELIYSDQIGAWVADMGYKAMITEGAKHILGWKNPDYLYCNALNPRLKLLLRNYRLSDDISLRFSDQSWSEYPLTSEKYVSWIKSTDSREDVVNIFMDYATLGENQRKETGVFEFFQHFVKQSIESNLNFSTPSEVADKFQPVSALNVPYPISWADEERDLTAWLGNELQNEAFKKLYDLVPLVNATNDNQILVDWKFIQNSDHLYYMCTKFFSDGQIHKYTNPYASPYDAFINFMNVLSDFRLRLEKSATIPSEKSLTVEIETPKAKASSAKTKKVAETAEKKTATTKKVKKIA
jgi:alpha-amylase